jgi:tetratricopeptide (TPR) repeat protein
MERGCASRKRHDCVNKAGLAHLSLKQWEDAVNSLTAATEIKPDYAEAYFRLGQAYNLAGRSSKARNYIAAEAAFKAAVALRPDYFDALLSLSEVQRKLGKAEESTENQRKASLLLPPTPPAEKPPAETAPVQPPPKRQATPEEAAQGQLNLARAYRDNGLNDKASELFRSVVKAYPDTKAAAEARKEIEKMSGEGKK